MRRGLLAALLTGQTMASMDGSIVTVALPHIRADLHASGAILQLVTGGYILAMAVLVVTGARLGDLFGHRRIFLLGLGGFTAASLACGLAPDGVALVVSRVVQGAAAALVLPQVLSMIQLHFTGPARARALGTYSMVLALGVALGQIVGGLIVTAAGWRPAFLINVPVGLTLVVVGGRILPGGAVSRGRAIDLPGVAILSAAMTALTLPLIFGREQGRPAWSWVCLAAGCAGLAGFAVHESRVASPLLDLAVLRIRGVAAGLFACCAVMGAYTALLFSLALHLQGALGLSARHAGLTFLPYTIGFAVAGRSWPRLPSRRFLPVAGLACFATAAPFIAVVARHGGPAGVLAPLLVVAGAGHATGFSPLVERIAATVGPARASAVSALTNTGTLLASVTAIATLGGVYLAAARSADGLVHVSVAISVLLGVAAISAWRTGRTHPAATAATTAESAAVPAGEGPAAR